MPDAVFTLTADIVPVIDARKLEEQASLMSKQLNTILAKSSQTVEINTSTKNFQKSILDTSKITDAFNVTLEKTKNVAAAAYEAGRAGFVKFADAINLTNTKLIAYGGNIRQAIADNSRFKAALDVVKNSAGAIANLPENFKVLSAQIASGTSGLQQLAARGVGFARSLVPFLLIGEEIHREMEQVNLAVQNAAVSIERLARASGAGQKGLNFFKSEGADLEALFKRIAGTVAPQLGQQFLNAFDEEKVKGPQAVIEALKRLSKEQAEATDGFGHIVDVSKLVRDGLFDIDRRALSLGDQIRVVFSRITTSIRGSGLNAAIKSQLTDAELGTKFFDTLQLRFDDITRRGVPAFKALGATLNETFTKTNIGQTLTEARAVVIQFGTEIGKAVGDGVKVANNELQKLVVGFQTGNLKGAAQSVASDIGKAFKGLFSGEGLGGERGASALDLLTAPLNAIKALLGGLGKVAFAPFKLLESGAKLAAAPLGLFKNILGEALGPLGGFAVGGVGVAAALTGIGVAALHTAADFETYKIAFEGLFGPGQGDKVIALALDFDKLTHFDLKTTVLSIEQLAGAIQNIQPTGAVAILNQLAGAAAAVGAGSETIQRVVLAFTQISAAGKLTAQDLNQISQAIPAISRTNVYAQIAKDLGVTNQKAKQLAAEGLVDSKTALSAVLQVAHDVPGAATAMEKQSQSFKGLITIVGNELTKQVLIPFGTKLLPLAKLVLDALINLFEKLGPILQNVGKHIGDFFDALAHAPIIGGLVRRAIDNLGGSLKATGAAAQIAGTDIQSAKDALDVLKNSAQKFHLEADKSITALGQLAARALLMHQAVGGFQSDAVKITAIANALDQLSQTKDFGALKTGIEAVKQLASQVKLSPEAQRAFDQWVDAGNNAVDAQTSHIHDILTKVLEEETAFKAQTDAQKAVTKAQQDFNDLLAGQTKTLETQHIQLTKDLTSAQNSLTDANNRLAAAQQALNDAQKPASADELLSAEDNLASAHLRLRQLLEDEKKAQDDLNKSQTTAVDLTGLSVDQIKSRLSLARAALASQKAAQKSNAKDAEQQAIDEQTNAINKNEAEISIRNAEREILTLKQKGSALDPAVISAKQAVADAAKAQQEATEKTQEAQAALTANEQESAIFNKAIAEAKKNGVVSQTTLNALSAIDLGLVRQIQSSQDSITSAKEQQKQADEDAQIAVSEARGDHDATNKILLDRINTLDPRLQEALRAATTSTSDTLSIQELITGQIDKTTDSVKILVDWLNQANALTPDITKVAEEANKASLLKPARPFLEELKKQGGGTLVLNGEKVKVDKDGILHWPDGSIGTIDMLSIKELADFLVQGQQFTTTREKIDFTKFQANPAVQQLLADPTIATRLLEVLPVVDFDITKALQLIAHHLHLTIPGLAKGGVIDKATHAIFGEDGIEAVLPLTKPASLQDILSHPQVLPPVLEALGRISLPTTATTSEPVPLSDIRMSRSGPQIPVHHEQAKRDQALAKAIVSEMKDAGIAMGQTVVNNEFVAPDANDPLANVRANQIAREVKRQIEKLLG
jgi:tape measure domain-containing protein